MLSPFLSSPIIPLPQWVYDAVADPLETSVIVPYGRYTLPADFAIERSNLNLDFNGSKIFITPTTGSPFAIFSDIDEFVDPEVATRWVSHLTGTITTGTTQLTMDADEIMDLTPGEIVQVMAGVNTSDPLEPHRYILAEVLSVSGQVITFTAPLGENVTVYANEAALQAVTAAFLWDRIGPWGNDYLGSNFKKGLGTDHGLIRYVGGIVHDVTIRNFNLEVTLPADADIHNFQEFYVRDVLRASLLNWTCHNYIGSLVHTFRCNDFLADGYTVTGQARSKIFEPDQIAAGYGFSSWGGTNLTYKNGSIQGTNMQLANTEASPANILYQTLLYNVNFDGSLNYPAPATVLGFYGTTLGSGVRIEDASIAGSGDPSDWVWDPGNILTFENLVVPHSTFDYYFYFNQHIVEGTITVNSVTYGPVTVVAHTVVRTAGSNKTITVPKGFYNSARFRVTAQGSAVALYDPFGNDYVAALSSGAWTPVEDVWYQFLGGESIATHLGKQRFTCDFSGGSSCIIEFEIEYLPAPDDPGWVLD